MSNTQNVVKQVDKLDQCLRQIDLRFQRFLEKNLHIQESLINYDSYAVEFYQKAIKKGDNIETTTSIAFENMLNKREQKKKLLQKKLLRQAKPSFRKNLFLQRLQKTALQKNLIPTSNIQVSVSQLTFQQVEIKKKNIYLNYNFQQQNSIFKKRHSRFEKYEKEIQLAKLKKKQQRPETEPLKRRQKRKLKQKRLNKIIQKQTKSYKQSKMPFPKYQNFSLTQMEQTDPNALKLLPKSRSPIKSTKLPSMIAPTIKKEVKSATILKKKSKKEKSVNTLIQGIIQRQKKTQSFLNQIKEKSKKYSILPESPYIRKQKGRYYISKNYVNKRKEKMKLKLDLSKVCNLSKIKPQIESERLSQYSYRKDFGLNIKSIYQNSPQKQQNLEKPPCNTPVLKSKSKSNKQIQYKTPKKVINIKKERLKPEKIKKIKIKFHRKNSTRHKQEKSSYHKRRNTLSNFEQEKQKQEQKFLKNKGTPVMNKNNLNILQPFKMKDQQTQQIKVKKRIKSRKLKIRPSKSFSNFKKKHYSKYFANKSKRKK